MYQHQVLAIIGYAFVGFCAIEFFTRVDIRLTFRWKLCAKEWASRRAESISADVKQKDEDTPFMNFLLSLLSKLVTILIWPLIVTIMISLWCNKKTFTEWGLSQDHR